jgi:hypothetical protein
MAQSNENPLTKGLSGSIGKELTYRQRAGKTIVSKYRRKTTVPPTEKLVSIRGVFASAIAYARKVINDPALKAMYEAAAKEGQTAFNVATSDALKAPQVTAILMDGYCGNPGDHIVIDAMDDFKVAAVAVFIQQATGEWLEHGNAVLDPGTTKWFYKAMAANPAPEGSVITAMAKDLPGNTTSFTVLLA